MSELALTVPVMSEIKSVATEDLQETVRSMAAAIDIAYFALGGLLVRINTTASYLDYGYNNFNSYCQMELGFKKRKADYLIQIYQCFVIDLSLNEAKLDGISWTSASAIAGIVDSENADFWLEKARDLSYRELVDAVRQARTQVDDQNEAEEISDVAAPIDPQGEVETTSKVMFRLYPAQEDVVIAALECAEQVTGSEKPGYLLELISLEYLSQHGDKQNFSLEWWLKQVEEKFNTRVIAASSDTELVSAAQAIIQEYGND